MVLSKCKLNATLSYLFFIPLLDRLLHWSQIALRLLRRLGHALLDGTELLYELAA